MTESLIPTPDTSTYVPSEGERNILNRIDNMLALSMKDSQKKRKQMRRNEEMVGGDHFAIFPNLDKDKSRVMYNMSFQTIETIIPVLTELLPKPDVFPEPVTTEKIDLDELFQKSQDIEDAIEYLWRKAGMRADWPMMLKTMLVYGQCPIRALPSKKTKFMDIEAIDNFGFFLDGGGATSLRDSEWIITAIPIYMSELIRVYGKEKTEGIVAQGKLDGFRQFHLFPEKNRRNTKTGTDAVTTDTDTTSATLDLDDKDNPAVNRSLGQVLLIDIWSRHRVSNEPITDNEIPEPMDKYHHLTKAGNRLLVDETSDYPVGEPPFVMPVNYPQPKSPWGFGESEQIESLDVAQDMLLSEATDAAIMGGNPPVTATEDMRAANPLGINLKPRKTVWKPTLSSRVEWMDPKQVSQALVELPFGLENMIQSVSGVHDATAGRKPGGVTAASAIARLQEAAANRINHKEKSSLRGPLSELYTKMLKHIEDLKKDESFISKNRFNGTPKISTFGPSKFKDSAFIVTAGVPVVESKTDLVNLLIELAPTLGLTPDELIGLMPPEIRDVIQSVRNRSQAQGPLSGLDRSKLSEEENAILDSGDEDAIQDLLINLTERGLFKPPAEQNLAAAPGGAANVQTAT